eukprot:TRINITY_DN67056_c7_g1_i2.p3 TRINITY_DN67056_c7_g1~~TRINITY_DN67056_c7_g1_i2.p3  ORF type:complete len:237 (+),score=119.44 TRINITY_DN67056_c7_g1_i2:99-713(+)
MEDLEDDDDLMSDSDDDDEDSDADGNWEEDQDESSGDEDDDDEDDGGDSQEEDSELEELLDQPPQPPPLSSEMANKLAAEQAERSVAPSKSLFDLKETEHGDDAADAKIDEEDDAGTQALANDSVDSKTVDDASIARPPSFSDLSTNGSSKSVDADGQDAAVAGDKTQQPPKTKRRRKKKKMQLKTKTQTRRQGYSKASNKTPR